MGILSCCLFCRVLVSKSPSVLMLHFLLMYVSMFSRTGPRETLVTKSTPLKFHLCLPLERNLRGTQQDKQRIKNSSISSTTLSSCSVSLIVEGHRCTYCELQPSSCVNGVAAPEQHILGRTLTCVQEQRRTHVWT